MFFLAEYANILLINTLSAVLFLGALYIPTLPELTSVNLITKAALLSILFL